MKHYMLPRTPLLKEASPSSEVSSSPNPKQRSGRKQKCSKENADPNMTLQSATPDSISAKPMKSPLPPRPPSSNPLKRKLSVDAVSDGGGSSSTSDSGVKVIVRMRPPLKDEEDRDTIVEKLSNDSLSINGQTFTFDSVADAEATQLDIFQLIGAPLVENCLAGFNSSVFAYGQTGSGKTYTMWGPASALLGEGPLNDQQGLTPRVLEQLFSRINEEQVKHTDKQLKYQCRCSFLEIYNEQITDLLEPSQKNLQIREDVKSGVYVENLTEECVSTMKDVIQLLLKGLSNRRTGATSINAESSRSHSVFTCVVESRCKSMADGLSSFKTSRINLVDLAGSERQKLTGAAGERLKEAGNINRSLSQLGNLINILADISQTGKQRHIPYRNSRLTFLLQDSLGGNAKMAMICAISPAQSCKSETFSTLRFAQRAKAIKNKAVVNEVMQDDVNFLREVIRQLKEELLRMKAQGNPSDPSGAYSNGWNARRSLNLLKFSMKRPMACPRVDGDGDAEMEIDEDAVDKFYAEAALQLDAAYKEDKFQRPVGNDSGHEFVEKQNSDVSDVSMEEGLSELDNNETMHVDNGETSVDVIKSFTIGLQEDEQSYTPVSNPSHFECPEQIAVDMLLSENSPSNPVSNVSTCLPTTEQEADNNCSTGSMESVAPPDLSIVPSDSSPVLHSPAPSVSPRILSGSRKSLRTSSMLAASEKDMRACSNIGNADQKLSFSKATEGCSSLTALSTRNSVRTTQNLADSLHQGLDKIIDNHRKSSPLRHSSFRFSFKPAEIKAVLSVAKVDVGVQTCLDADLQEKDTAEILCSHCKNRVLQDEPQEENNQNLDLQLVPVDGSLSAERARRQVPKAVEKVLTGAIRREMALEEYCSKQTSEIRHLNRLVQQYKHERECNAIIGQMREEKIIRLENLMDGVLPTEDFMEEEFASLHREHELLKEKYENHPDVLRTNIEMKRLQDELLRYQNFFDIGERDILLEEIQDLRNQLQYYIDGLPRLAQVQSSIKQLTYSCEPSASSHMSTIQESSDETAEEKLEQERIKWTEVESKWISLTEEMRVELETNRSLVEKLKEELDSEKKCSEELKEAMQLAMKGHARMLEQYADLEEKHMELLARHRNMREGIDDVKKAAAKAGVKGAESKFINALAAQISALKAEKEKERRYLRDENKVLQEQLRDTAEAVQAAGELIVRLKEAEEAVAAALKQSADAEERAEKAHRQMEKLKKKHEMEINTLNQVIEESRLPKEALPGRNEYHSNEAKYDVEQSCIEDDQQWKKEFETCFNDPELSKFGEPSSWFSGYDRCNI